MVLKCIAVKLVELAVAVASQVQQLVTMAIDHLL